MRLLHPTPEDSTKAHLAELQEQPGVDHKATKHLKAVARSGVDPLMKLAWMDQLALIILGSASYYQWPFVPSLSIHCLYAVGLASLVFSITAYNRQLYSYGRMDGIVRQLLPFSFTLFQTASCVGALLFITANDAALWFASWMASALIAMACFRLLYWKRFNANARMERYARKTILIGASDRAALMLRHLLYHREPVRIVGLFVTDEDGSGLASDQIFDAMENVPLLSSFDDLLRYCHDHAVDDIIITPELENHPDADSMLKALEVLPCTIKYCIPGNFFSRPLANVELISHIPVVTIFNTPLRGISLMVKRIEDVVLSSIALIIAAPIMAIVAALIALDGQGKIIFRQKRHGFGGQEFEIFKFRSMRVAKHDEEIKQVTRDDKRVTWIGKIIRRTSLDELPQLINVLRGEMSMVGPRPHAIMHNYYYRDLIDGYVARQRIKPGITGWAQINGWRGETDTLEKMRKRVEHDLYYVENWSLWFDLKILLLTAFTFMGHKNAY